jgi:hypothetical protein
VDARKRDDVFFVRSAGIFESRIRRRFLYRFNKIVSGVDFPERPPSRDQTLGVFQRFFPRESDVRKKPVRGETFAAMQPVGTVGKFSIR